MLDSFSKNIVQPIKYKVFDTESTLQLGQLRYLFMRDINLYQHLGNHFNDSCTRAELCYYLPFYDSSILYKSWLVSPLNSPKPNSIYYDSTGGLATYNDL